MINHLFRAEIRIDTGTAGAALVSVVGGRGSVRKGEVRVFAEDGAGVRKSLATIQAASAGVRVTVPAGTKKVAAVLRGEDDAGDLVAVGESAIR
jgi:hypothetical protein